MTQHVKREWTIGSADVAQSGIQQTLAGIGTSIGWPTSQLADVSGQAVRVIDAVSAAMGGESFSWALSEALSEVALRAKFATDTIGSAAEVVASVPIIGAIVNVVMGVVTQAQEVIRAREAAKEAAADIAASFNPQADRLWFDGFRGLLAGSRNWGGAFGPQGNGRWASQRLKGKGVRIYRLGLTPDRYGQVPGTDFLSNTIEVVPYGSSRRPWRVVDTGQYLPTTAQQATWLWGVWGSPTATPQNGAPYTIDANALAQMWREHLYWLRRYLWANRNEWWGDHARRIVEHFEPVYHWSPWGDEPKPRSGQTSRDAIGWGASYNLWNPQNPLFLAIDDLRRAQQRGLGGIATMYVDESFAGVVGREGQWTRSAQEFLQRADVKVVDPTNVVDRQLRSAVEARGARGLPPATKSFASIKQGFTKNVRIAAVGDRVVGVTEPKVGRIRAVGSSDGSGAALGVLGAAAGLGVYLWRRRR